MDKVNNRNNTELAENTEKLKFKQKGLSELLSVTSAISVLNNNGKEFRKRTEINVSVVHVAAGTGFQHFAHMQGDCLVSAGSVQSLA